MKSFSQIPEARSVSFIENDDLKHPNPLVITRQKKMRKKSLLFP